MMLEKSEGVRSALAVAPLGASDYLVGKVITLTGMATLSSALLVFVHGAPNPLLMLVTAPSPGTPLTLTTRFAWQAVPGTYLYKLEIFGAPSGPAEIVANDETVSSVPLDPVPDTGSVQGRQALTGIVAPGAVTEVRLKDYSLAHLPPDRRYLWTVKAIDQNGTLLGVSPPREIYKP